MIPYGPLMPNSPGSPLRPNSPGIRLNRKVRKARTVREAAQTFQAPQTQKRKMKKNGRFKKYITEKKARTVLLVLITASLVRLLLSFGAYMFTRGRPELAGNVYSRKIFPAITAPMKFFASLVPFSVGETLVILAAVLLIAGLAVCVVRTIKKKKPRGFLRVLAAVLAAAMLVGGNFFVYGGINYHAAQFKDISGLEVENTDTETLQKLCVFLGEKATEARNRLTENEKGVVRDERTLREILLLSPDGYGAAANEFPCLEGWLVAPKGAAFSEIMSYEQISGIFPIVYTESVVNTNTAVYDVPHVACHELAHQLGFAREDEANFIGFLAAINNSDPLYVYSGYYNGFCYAMNMLYKYDKSKWEAVWGAENIDGQGISRDMRASNEIWDAYRKKAPAVSRISEAVNDSYLKSNDIDDGVRSYGRVVDLLIAYYREDLAAVQAR